MIYIFGPYAAGKREYVRETFGYTEADFSTKAEDSCRVLHDAQQLASKVGNQPEELEKRLAQALRKKQPLFVFHWRGGGLNRQILSELLALAGTLAQARGKQASCSVNVPQAVIQLQFSDAPEPDITIQQANEGEAAPETQTVSE